MTATNQQSYHNKKFISINDKQCDKCPLLSAGALNLTGSLKCLTSPFLLQWTSEPYESIDASNSNAAVTVREGGQSSDQGFSQGLDKTQEESASASTAPEPADQKTV